MFPFQSQVSAMGISRRAAISMFHFRIHILASRESKLKTIQQASNTTLLYDRLVARLEWVIRTDWSSVAASKSSSSSAQVRVRFALV
jgi:hypothetical protein